VFWPNLNITHDVEVGQVNPSCLPLLLRGGLPGAHHRYLSPAAGQARRPPRAALRRPV